MLKEESQYEEWLTTIVNTRLLYNTMEEFEHFMGNHSIHNNGIKRVFPTEQKKRSAFRDLKVEVALMTNGAFALDDLLKQYEEAWTFYKNNLSRCAKPGEIALQLLRYRYSFQKEKVREKMSSLFGQVIENDISIPFIVLMLLKIIPGYDSKNGDIPNMNELYEQTMLLLEKITAENILVEDFPAIKIARNEEYKNRLMLLYHFSKILNIFESYATSRDFYEMASSLKDCRINLDLEGFWNECGGLPNSTEFWEFEQTINIGSFFATHWRKSGERKLKGIKYAMYVIEADDENAIAYFLHPKFIKHRMQGLRYTDSDHMWYKISELISDTPDNLILSRVLASDKWRQKINLTKVTDESTLNTYNNWRCTYEFENEFADCEYKFTPNLYAITQEAIYISTGQEGEYYKIPRDAHEGFEQIKLDDNVGIMEINGKVYLCFDELELWINTSAPEELAKYKIEMVGSIN